MLDGILQKIDVLHQLCVGMAGHGDLIPHAVMLDHVAEGDAAAVRADGHAVFGGQQNDCHYVIHAGDADGINLAVSNRAALQQLLEDHGRRRLFAAGKIKGGIGEGLGQFHITEYIVAGDGFLDPLQAKRSILLDVLLGLGQSPVLVGINHQLRVRPDGVAHEPNSRHVQGGVLTDLQLKCIEPFRLQFADGGEDFFIAQA